VISNARFQLEQRQLCPGTIEPRSRAPLEVLQSDKAQELQKTRVFAEMRQANLSVSAALPVKGV
jgi:hypothetical protein